MKRILAFHDVLDSNLFSKRLDLCLFLGYKFVSMDYILDNIHSKEKLITITFDDGYKSVIDNAIPVLIKRKIPALFFTTINFLDKEDDDLKFFLKNNLLRNSFRYPMSKKDILNIKDNYLFEIGAHTFEHKRLNDSLSKEDLFEEIIKSGDELERLTNKKIKYFAYPFGDKNSYCSYSDDLVKSRYNAGFSIIYGNIEDIKDRSFIERDSLDPERSFFIWFITLLGFKDFFKNKLCVV